MNYYHVWKITCDGSMTLGGVVKYYVSIYLDLSLRNIRKYYPFVRIRKVEDVSMELSGFLNY